MADGAQENGIELLELLQCTVRQDLAGALVALSSWTIRSYRPTTVSGSAGALVV
jgi:hypothetical protein